MQKIKKKKKAIVLILIPNQIQFLYVKSIILKVHEKKFIKYNNNNNRYGKDIFFFQ